MDRPGGFVLPHPPRDSRTFPTPSGRAEFAASPIETLEVPPGHLVLQTLRSHDQFNTTIYGLSDRYRGIEGGRRVVFLHRTTCRPRVRRRATSWTWSPTGPGTTGGVRRRASGSSSYETPRGSAAAYYPETNPLVPLDSTALGSNTPTSKSVVIRLERPGTETAGPSGGQDAVGADEGHKSRPQPTHLS